MKKFFSILCLVTAFMAVNANVPTQPEPKKCVESVIQGGASADYDYVIFVPMLIESPSLVLNAPIVYGDFILDNVDMIYIEAKGRPPTQLSCGNRYGTIGTDGTYKKPDKNFGLVFLKLDKLYLCGVGRNSCFV